MAVIAPNPLNNSSGERSMSSATMRDTADDPHDYLNELYEALQRPQPRGRRSCVDRIAGTERRGKRHRERQHDVRHRDIAGDRYRPFRQIRYQPYARVDQDSRYQMCEAIEDFVFDQRVVPGDRGACDDCTYRAQQQSFGNKLGDDSAGDEDQKASESGQKRMVLGEPFKHRSELCDGRASIVAEITLPFSPLAPRLRHCDWTIVFPAR